MRKPVSIRPVRFVRGYYRIRRGRVELVRPYHRRN